MYLKISMTSQEINSHKSSSAVKGERCRDSFYIRFRGVYRGIFIVWPYHKHVGLSEQQQWQAMRVLKF